MSIREINLQDQRAVDQFVRFPFELYANCPQWVPPLISEARAALDPRKHPFFEHSEAAGFLAEQNGKIRGRILVMNNQRANQFRKTQEAFFGFFEAVEDLSVSQALFSASFDWARQRGLTRMLGPRGLIGSDSTGVLIEGFEHRPALSVSYNFAYYDRLIQAAGFVTDTEHLSGYLSGSYTLPERLVGIAEKVKTRRGFWVKSFTSKEEMREWVPKVITVHRQAFEGTHTFYPLTEKEFEAVANSIINISRPELIKLIMQTDEVIGFIFCYPDVSEGLQKARGRLWPLGWYHLWQSQKNTKWININGVGLLPRYQGLGANAVLYTELAKSIRQFRFEHADIVMIDAQNFKSFADMETLGLQWYKRHRSYCRNLEE